MRITIASNLAGLADVSREGVEIRFVPIPSGGVGGLARARALVRVLACDYAVVNCSPRELFELCFLKLLLPFTRCRVVSLDTVLPVPRPVTTAQRTSLWAKRLLFRQPHLFVEYFRDTAGYEMHYGIARHRFRYVPFKVNRYEKVIRTPVRDDGYIFCGGNTRRDFRTLLEAVRDLPYPVRIVTMPESVIGQHGSSLDERHLPENVQVIRHDGSESFVDHIAAARLVVLPIQKENISASGIGVYLASMALGKCVVISDGPAVRGVLPEGAALVVPPEDPLVLRAAIVRAYSDDAFRETVAGAGRRYALDLGGEERLCASVLDLLINDSAASAGASQALPGST